MIGTSKVKEKIHRRGMWGVCKDIRSKTDTEIFDSLSSPTIEKSSFLVEIDTKILMLTYNYEIADVLEYAMCAATILYDISKNTDRFRKTL